MGSHAVRGHVNRRRGCQQGTVGLLLQFAVGALDVAFGQRVASGAVDADRPCAVVAMPPLSTRGLPVSTSIWSAGV